jgi:hypothetical protein
MGPQPGPDIEVREWFRELPRGAKDRVGALKGSPGVRGGENGPATEGIAG